MTAIRITFFPVTFNSFAVDLQLRARANCPTDRQSRSLCGPFCRAQSCDFYLSDNLFHLLQENTIHLDFSRQLLCFLLLRSFSFMWKFFVCWDTRKKHIWMLLFSSDFHCSEVQHKGQTDEFPWLSTMLTFLVDQFQQTWDSIFALQANIEFRYEKWKYHTYSTITEDTFMTVIWRKKYLYHKFR